MLRCSGSSQYPGSSVLDELQLSNGLLGKAGEETITIIHPAGDKGMNKFLQILTGNKTSIYCNDYEMIICWFNYCFDMTTETKVCLQNHLNIFDLIFCCLTPRVTVCIQQWSNLLTTSGSSNSNLPPDMVMYRGRLGPLTMSQQFRDYNAHTCSVIIRTYFMATTGHKPYPMYWEWKLGHLVR